MSPPFRVVSAEPLLASRVFDVERRLISDGDQTFSRDVVVHRGAVAVLAFSDAGQIGVIRQYRSTFDTEVREIPAGTLDVAGEDPLDAARRELREELGREAATWTLLGRFMVSPGWCDQVMTIFEARGLTEVPRDPAGPEESASTVEWHTPDGLLATLRADRLVDFTTTVALHRVYGRFFDVV
ncbi:MAG: NUDIX domain-containing protein [Acidimicrobiales bacterium]